MDIENSLIDYKTEVQVLIIKESSAKLFNFDRLVLREPIESIQPDAQFLFVNLKQIFLEFCNNNASIREIARTINQFEQINILNNRKIASIDLKLDEIREKSKDLELLAGYRIEKLF
jgi:hypothetical protein